MNPGAKTFELYGGESRGGQSEGRLLPLALAAALAIHLGLIGAIGFLPAWKANGVDLEAIHVFNQAPVASAEPVEMVSLPKMGEVPKAPAVVIPKPTPAITPPVTVRPKTSEVLPQDNPKPPKPTGPKNIAGNSLKNLPSGNPSPAPAKPPVVKVTPSANPGSGGGGGAPKILIANGGNGTPSVGTGNTPGGQVAGGGSGSGSGNGSGSGSGTGSGQGSGSGEGSGPGKNAGSGSGSGPGEGGAGFVSRQADRSEPKVQHKGPFSYPESAAGEGVEGTVSLKVLVSAQGQVKQVEITASSGDRRLDNAAETWLRTWSYLPAVQDGEPREVWTKAKVIYRLE
jgi:TonB family protein